VHEQEEFDSLQTQKRLGKSQTWSSTSSEIGKNFAFSLQIFRSSYLDYDEKSLHFESVYHIQSPPLP